MTISDPIAISIEQLGKRYRLGTHLGPYRTLRETITDALKAPFREAKQSFWKGPLPPGSDTIWALKDVFLEVPHGEILGIIGRNGAGKTTLLKVLSRITEPTEGRVRLRGRVGSLLEVGTGFHLELTGRENIFMNGAILGMSRREIQAKFEEIVSFAEIEPFLDTPLKRYSTGMGTRLAFAIAAHLDTDILLVDEVLAVGDLGFRKKCLGKMQDVTQAGRTVLFVSHDMNSIRRLCRSAVWLDQGRVMATGEVQEVVTQYEASFLDADGQRAARVERRNPPKSQKWFSWVSLSDAQGNPASVFKYGDSLHLTIGMEGRASYQTHYVEWYLNEISHGNRVAFGGTHTFPDGDVPGDCQEISFIIGPIPLTEGNYSLSFIMGVAGIINLDFWYDAITFEVTDADPFKTGYHYRTNYAPSVITYKIK